MRFLNTGAFVWEQNADRQRRAGDTAQKSQDLNRTKAQETAIPVPFGFLSCGKKGGGIKEYGKA